MTLGAAKAAYPATSTAGHWQIFGAPRGDAATQIGRLGEALRRKLPGGGGAERARLAVHQQRLLSVFLECLPGSENLVCRQLPRAVQVSRGELRLRPDIEHQRAMIHQPDGFLR
jgi:hypothetical protein